MRMLDLFSGIGGFSLAASWVWGDELEIVSFCEIDKFCRKVLNKHWPNVPIHDDIKTLKGDYFGAIDIVCGGFPCQPFSVAGKQRGATDDRALWPEMFRVIQESRPRWIIGENVAGIVNMELDNYLTDLEKEGYETQSFIIPACGKDAPHRRNRVWIVANTKSECNRFDKTKWQRGKVTGRRSAEKYVADAKSTKCEFSGDSRTRWNGFTDCCFIPDDESIRFQRIGTAREQIAKTHGEQELSLCNCGNAGMWQTEPAVGRVANGISDRVDRLKGLGNAIVPQVAAEIMSAIKKVDWIETV